MCKYFNNVHYDGCGHTMPAHNVPARHRVKCVDCHGGILSRMNIWSTRSSHDCSIFETTPGTGYLYGGVICAPCEDWKERMDDEWDRGKDAVNLYRVDWSDMSRLESRRRDAMWEVKRILLHGQQRLFERYQAMLLHQWSTSARGRGHKHVPSWREYSQL